jgi:hypothetical protein
MIVHRASVAGHSQTVTSHRMVVMVAADPKGAAHTVVAHRVAVVAADRAVHRAFVRRWAVAAAPADPIGVAQRAVARMMMVVMVACSYYRLCPSMVMFSYASLYKNCYILRNVRATRQ